MADKETGLNITVGAVADEKSAERAVKDISKKVDSSLKDGRIEIPVELKAPLKGASDDLIKAQEDVIRKWEAASKKGFSSSSKEADALINSYARFKRLVGLAHKNNQTQVKDLDKIIAKQVQSLRIARSTKQEEIKPQKTTRKDKYNPDFGKHSKAEIQANEKAYKNRLYKGTKGTGPKGLGTGWIDPGRTNEREAKLSEVSSYPSNMARQIRQSEKESQKWMKDSLVSDKYATKEELETELTKRREKDKIQGGTRYQPGAIEKATQLSEDLRKNILPELLGKIQASADETEINTLNQKFFDTLDTISKLSHDAGKLILSDVSKDIGIVMAKLGFTTKGNIGGTEGGDKTEISRDPKIVATVKGLLDKVAEKEEAIKQELIKLEQIEARSTSSTVAKEINSFANRIIAENRSGRTNTRAVTSAIEKQTMTDMVENSAERIADSKEEQLSTDIKDIEKTDAEDGMNSEANAQTLLGKLDDIKGGETEETTGLIENLKTILGGQINSKTGKCPCEEILNTISGNVQLIANKLVGTTTSAVMTRSDITALVPLFPAIMKTITERTSDKRYVKLPGQDQWDAAFYKKLVGDIEREREQIETGTHPLQQRSKELRDRSQVETSIMDFTKKLPTLFSQKIIAATSKEQDKMNADLIRRYGIGANTGVMETGDKVRFARRRSLWGGTSQLAEVFKNFKLTPGIKIDTTEITEAIAKALSGPEMAKAQSGGILNNLAIAMTGGLAARFQPSLEKSRAQADVVNSAMAELRNAINTVIQDILSKESVLGDMESAGDIMFNKDGSIFSGTDEARMVAIELERSKEILASLLADAGMVEEVTARTGGHLGAIIKRLGFTSPMLRKINVQLANVNAGLDKTGKAFKFQRRDQEILNYTFQLMSRHIGQILKRFLLMLNPISLIRKAFSDFASYDVKWQRTMNVIKYNLRRIILPAMQWIAQQLVNIIGLGNALIKGIGRVFGQNWDLFDQSAASAEQMREELEAAANVTAGFDELHDIGGESSSNPAMDLMGDIYTPQWNSLYEGIEAFGAKVAGVFKTIKDTVDGWSFWEWLAVGAGVVSGVLLFRWLIDLFSKGKNPVQSVADGFKSLEKLAGLALVISSIALLTETLKNFYDVVGHMEWGEITKGFAALGAALGTVGLVILALLVALSAIISTGVGALAIVGLAAIIAAIALVIGAIAGLTLAINELIKTIVEHADEVIELMKTAGAIIIAVIQTIGDTVEQYVLAIATGISTIINTIFTGIQNTISTIGSTIVTIIQGVADSIMTVLQPIMDFIDGMISKVVELASTIAHEVGETIRTVIKTTGEIIIGVIHELLNAIPNLLNSILTFCREIGPAIETSVNAVMRSVTRLINFIISGIEYMINTLVIGSINRLLAKLPGDWSISSVSIDRFVPQYEQGTNYIPNDGLAYLHQGEAVIPKKYNQPYSGGLSSEERTYMQQMIATMRSVDDTMRRGIPVSGEFVQRGSDLVAVVNKTKSQTGADLLSNVSYAR